MKKQNVLVSGASIAGLTLAYWLDRYGFSVTVIEKSEGLRLGGQNIDVKGAAWEIIRKMELEEKIRQANTTERGLRFVNKENAILAEFPKVSALSMTQELEILRGDLVKILNDKLPKSVEVLYNRFIKHVAQDEDGVEVTYQDATKRKFDYLLIAEGIGSSTRKMVFDEATKFVFLGLYTAYFSAERKKTDNDWARWYNAPGGLVYLIRPDNHGQIRICINLRAAEKGYEKLRVAAQKELLIAALAGKGWESDRIIEAVKQSGDFYMERLSQVKAPHWSRGRVAMVGDAAYCVTPIGGKGTDLAITGAYLLAGELHRCNNFARAFAQYENQLRPLVSKSQKTPPGVPALIYPTSPTGIKILNTCFRIAGSKLVNFLVRTFSGDKTKPKADITLPDYSSAAG